MKKRIAMIKRYYNVGDAIEFENKYYGLIVEVNYVNDSIYLKVLNTSGHVRQLNLMYSKNCNYSYRVINL